MLHFTLRFAKHVLILGCFTAPALSQDQPRPTPLTRPEMKELLEDVKHRQPRIPLPELTQSDQDLLGDRSDNYESRLRYHYLPQTPSRGPITNGAAGAGVAAVVPRSSRESDPNATLDYGFKVELFWIVSRVNNCHYCLGHQESKLLGAGLHEDRIAALDGDWSEFTAKEQTAFAFARQFTYQPHLLGDADIELLSQHFTDLQIIEMMLSMAWNNSINRWKEAAGVPQNPDEGGYSRLARMGTTASNDSVKTELSSGSYLTPTSAKFQDSITNVAPLAMNTVTGLPTTATICVRPTLEPREQVIHNIELAANRKSRLPLASIEVTREVMSLDAGDEVKHWMRLIAHFPLDGARRGRDLNEALNGETLTPLLKAQIRWIVARNDRAWYALAHARDLLHALGWTDDQIFSLDEDWSEFTQREQSCFRLAKNLAASPVILTDREVADAVASCGPKETVQAIQLVTQLTALSRLSEAAGLPLE